MDPVPDHDPPHPFAAVARLNVAMGVFMSVLSLAIIVVGTLAGRLTSDAILMSGAFAWPTMALAVCHFCTWRGPEEFDKVTRGVLITGITLAAFEMALGGLGIYMVARSGGIPQFVYLLVPVGIFIGAGLSLYHHIRAYFSRLTLDSTQTPRGFTPRPLTSLPVDSPPPPPPPS